MIRMNSLPHLSVKRPALGLWSLVAAVMASPALAVTPEELQGDFVLTALTIDYGGFPPTIDEDDFTTLTGYFSATGKALLYEHSGQDNRNFTIYRQRTAGNYQVSGSAATVSDATGPVANITLQMPSSATLIVIGTGVDSNSQTYQYTYEFTREETYYSQEQLDEAIEDVTADLFTQEQVDAAVAEALENVEPKAVVIPLFD